MCLVEIAITTILDNGEDERTFSSPKFIKSKLMNRLEGNLDTVLRIFCQDYYNLESFLYADAYKQWQATKEWQGVHECVHLVSMSFASFYLLIKFVQRICTNVW